MKLIYKLILISMLATMACKKEPKVDAPKSNEPIAATPFNYNTNFRTIPQAIYGDWDGNCFVIGGGYAFKLNSKATVENTMALNSSPWNRNYSFTTEGHFYSSINSSFSPRKEELILYTSSPYQSPFYPPSLVKIKQTKLQNPLDEVTYWFGSNYPSHVPNMFSKYSCLQTAAKLVKNAITGKIDTSSVLLNITNPLEVSDEQELTITFFGSKRLTNFYVYATSQYVLVSHSNDMFYRYDSQLNYIDSFSNWPDGGFWIVNNQFLHRDRGYFLSPNGSDEGTKVELLEETDRIINVYDNLIYVEGLSGDLYYVDLSKNTRTFIVNKFDKRFNRKDVFNIDIWKSKTGNYFLFTNVGLYVI